jgi:hypothetical protein
MRATLFSSQREVGQMRPTSSSAIACAERGHAVIGQRHHPLIHDAFVRGLARDHESAHDARPSVSNHVINVPSLRLSTPKMSNDAGGETARCSPGVDVDTGSEGANAELSDLDTRLALKAHDHAIDAASSVVARPSRSHV